MIVIRPATAADSDDLFAWRNDEQTRLSSVSQAPVERSEHDAWLARVLGDDRRRLLIAVLQDGGDGSAASVGTCRFDFDTPATAEVSINLNPLFRGRGLAVEVLAAAIAWIETETGGSVALRASIRPANRASARVFASVGFERVGENDGLDAYERAAAAAT